MKTHDSAPLLNFSEQRIESLTEVLNKLKELLLKDELIKTLKGDGISKEFISLRIQEIIENFLNSDRELLLRKTMKKYSKLKENCQMKIRELTEEVMTEKLKNKEMEDIHFADEKKIEKLEKKLSNFHEAQEKIMLLEKNNQSFQKKIESLFEEKEILENNYKSYTMEIEKSFMEEKEQKDEQNGKYRTKLKYYKSSIEELVAKLDEYETKNNELQEQIKEIYNDNVQMKEDLKCLFSENNSNKAKAKIYKNISIQTKMKFIGKIKEICFQAKKDQNLMGKWINDCLFKTFGLLNESFKELLKKIHLYKMKYHGVKENLEEKINKLQGNLAAIMGKFENVKGSFNNEYEEKIKEIQKLKENSWETEKSNENFKKEIDFLKRTVDEKERELERHCYEKQKLMKEIMEDEIKYKKLVVGYEEEMEKNRALMKELGKLNEFLLKKNVNENIKAECFKKIQKITKKL